MAKHVSRRAFLGAMGALAAGGLAGCRTRGAPSSEPEPSPGAPGKIADRTTPGATPAQSLPTAPTVTPTPRPAGTETRLLMAGTAWETPATLRASGIPGPALVVLGGVHGNEPGGWMAAEAIASWTPAAGVLAVVPRANERAIAGFLRLVDGEGDLNRQYPGNPASDLAMERMAAEITKLAGELRAEVLLDLHESWAFYVDRPATEPGVRLPGATAFLGQTVTGGEGPRSDIAGLLAATVNAGLPGEREHLIARAGSAFRRDDTTPAESNRGRSSLALGGHVPGLTPVLVEMGQEGQAIERRAELHGMVVRATMDLLGL